MRRYLFPIILFCVFILIFLATQSFTFWQQISINLPVFNYLEAGLVVLFTLSIYYSIKQRDFVVYANSFFPFLILFTFCYFTFRLPYYVSPMVGEDTIFADIFINQPQGPLYCIVAQINGDSIYNFIAHPAPLYEVLKMSGFLSNFFIDYTVFNDLELSAILRLFYSCFQYSIFLMLLFIANKSNVSYKWLLNIFLLIISITPMSIESSTDLQIDGSSGILLSAPLSIILMLISINPGSRYSIFALFLATVIFGLGKQEWSLMMLCSLVALVPANFVLKKIQKVPDVSSHVYVLFVTGLLGVILGNIVSYLYDKSNYTMGLQLFTNMIQSFTIISLQTKDVIVHTTKGFNIVMQNKNADWLKLTSDRLEFVYIIIMLIFFNFYLLIKNLKYVKSSQVLLMLISLSLFFAYFISSWGSFFRYFSPAFIATVICVFSFNEYFKVKFNRQVLIFIISLSTILTVRSYSLKINIAQKIKPEYYNLHIIEDPILSSDCVNLVNISINKPDNIDFTLKFYGLLPQNSKKPLCK